jgi:hypothetical protein
MAPSVHHRLRWNQGGKSDVVAVGHVFLLVGTSFLGLGVLVAVYMVSDFLFGEVAGIAAAVTIGLTVLATWYALPLVRGATPTSGSANDPARLGQINCISSRVDRRPSASTSIWRTRSRVIPR